MLFVESKRFIEIPTAGPRGQIHGKYKDTSLDSVVLLVYSGELGRSDT